MLQRSVIFKTPLWAIKYPQFEEHKEQFLSCVKKVREQNKVGAKISNINGYQSNAPIIDGNIYPEFNPLFDFIGNTIVNNIVVDDGFIPCDVKICNAWININETREAINAPHTHEGIYSGVFYLKFPPGSGELAFVNDSSAQMWTGNKLTKKGFDSSVKTTYRIKPTEASILIWHAYSMHYVLPNAHDDERISIAFNVDCIPRDKNNENLD